MLFTKAAMLSNLGRAVSDPPADNARIFRNACVNGGRVGDRPS